MTEQDPQQPFSPDPTRDAGTATAGDPVGDDSLSRLHRMSRTAGLGTQDYVAINAMAITAFLLGVAGVLSLLFSLLLIIPIAGVICAIIALRQIRNSGGTEVGRGWAWGGVLLSLAFIGIVGTSRFVEDRRTRTDKQAVMNTVQQFGEKLAGEDFAGAYAMMGPRFQERVPQSEFESQLGARFEYARHGKVTSMRSNQYVDFQSDPDRSYLFAITKAIIELSGRQPDNQQIALVKEGDRWLIEAFGWFPPQPLQPAR